MVGNGGKESRGGTSRSGSFISGRAVGGSFKDRKGEKGGWGDNRHQTGEINCALKKILLRILDIEGGSSGKPSLIVYVRKSTKI